MSDLPDNVWLCTTGFHDGHHRPEVICFEEPTESAELFVRVKTRKMFLLQCSWCLCGFASGVLIYWYNASF